MKAKHRTLRFGCIGMFCLMVACSGVVVWFGRWWVLAKVGEFYLERAQYQEALKYFEKALAARQEVGDRDGEARILNNSGLVYHHQGRYAEALDVFQQALAIHREVGNRPMEGGTLYSIGLVYYDQGRYAEALEVYQQALAIYREAGNRPMEGDAFDNIGNVHSAQGRYAEALEVYQQALAIHRQVGDRAGEGDTFNNIGAVHVAQGRYAEALEVYQQALAIRREVGDRAGEGYTLNNTGLVYHHQGRYAEALEVYQQALAIHREVGDRVGVGKGVTLLNIGNVHFAQGRYAEAMEVYQQALAIHREVGNRPAEGTTLLNVGNVHVAQGRYAEALEVFQQALAIHREVGNRPVEGASLNNIGEVHQAQGRYAEALVAYQEAMDTFERIRAVAGSEAGRATFIAQYAHLYTRAAGLFHQQGQAEEAFFTSERGRARAFLDSLATGHVELTDNEADALLVQEQEAYAGRQAAQDALVKARALDPPDPNLVADLQPQLDEAEVTYAAALGAIEARGDQLAAFVPGRSTVLTLSGVQALLDKESTLVSFFVLDDQTLAFLITHDSFHTVVLEVGREELITQIRAFRGFPNLSVAHPDSAVTLCRRLIEPLREYLPSTNSGQETTPHLAIVPHSVLHYLPFAALTDGQRYLVDDYVITYLPSASALKFILENAGGEPGVPLILGNPATDDPRLRPLRHAGREAQAVAALYDVQPLLSEVATESAVREHASQAGILHLAAHGEFNVYNPLYSTLYLAPDAANDGRLEVHEVYGLGLKNADLVVLSACQTQLGHELEAGKPLGVTLGDEIVGLGRAFIYAGTPSITSTLWSVDDRPTEMLMTRFYTHLRAGMGKAEALRQAQLDVRAEYPSPYYWAAFVLTGDPAVGKAE